MVLTCCVLFGAPVPAGAVAVFADKLVVKNRGTSASRKIVATAGPRDLGIFIYGSPDYPGGGATLTIIANGANPTMQTFSLPQGTGTNGNPFWRFVAAGGGGGYLYEDPRGEQGPVTTALVKSTANLSGTYRDTIKVVLRGKNGQIDVVPPNPGTDAFVTLEIWSGPIYCLKYGADGVVSNAGRSEEHTSELQSH